MTSPDNPNLARAMTPLNPMSPLIEFLDKCAALKDLPREDRIRAGIGELTALYPSLTAWLGYGKAEGVLHPCDDGESWWHLRDGVEWTQMDKTPLLASGVGPPPCYTTIKGRLVHIVHKPKDEA
jgi:hypothetical protein